LFSGFPESVKGCSVAFRAFSGRFPRCFPRSFPGIHAYPFGSSRHLRIPCHAYQAAPHSLSVVSELESKAELTRRGIRAIKTLYDPNLTGWVASLREKLLEAHRPKKRGGGPKLVEAFETAHQMAQSQALFHYLQKNPDALPLSDEARKAITAEVKDRTGVELPPGVDETWYYGFAAAETSAELADAYHSHLHGNPDAKDGFVEGIAKASKNPLHESQGLPGSNATPIYWTLLFYADIVEEFESMPELHRWLCEEHSEATVGDQKRIEGLCKGIELSFRSRGRPKKPKP
jgi:hypothetical protein